MNTTVVARQLHDLGFVTFRSGWSTTLRIPLLNAQRRIQEHARDREYRNSKTARDDQLISDAYERWASKTCFRLAVDSPVAPRSSGMTIERGGMIFRVHTGEQTVKPVDDELLAYGEQSWHPAACQQFHVNPYSYSLYTSSGPGSVVVRKFPDEDGRPPIIYWPTQDEHLLLTGKDYHATHYGIFGLMYMDASALHAGFSLEGERMELAYRETPALEDVIRAREEKDAPRAAMAWEAEQARSLEWRLAMIETTLGRGK